MLDPVPTLDSFIIERVFQPCADWCARSLGICNLETAEHLCEAAIGLFALQLLAYASAGSSGELVMMAVGDAWMCSHLLFFRAKFRRTRKDTERDFACGRTAANPLRLTMAPFRILVTGFWAVITVLDLVPPVEVGDMLTTAAWTVMVAAFFIASCQPRPPGHGRRSATRLGVPASAFGFSG